MAKVIVIGLIAAIAVFAITNAGLLNRGTTDNPGFKVAEATSKTSAQAGRLIQVFDSVNPHSAPVSAPGGTTTSNPPQEPSSEGNAGTTDYVSPADTAVKDAYGWMVYYANESGVDSQNEYIKAASTLREEWEPRYRLARSEYNKLNHQVEYAKKTADEYFDVQAELTNQIQDQALKDQLRKSDLQEKEVYRSWAEQADKTVLKAYEIMQDLEDMDVIIAKTNLSAHFAALNSSAQTLPASMKALHEELDYFRQASQDINSTFGFSPADAAQ